MININFPENCKKYLEIQCNSSIGDYQECPELAELDTFFSKINPKNVIELGAGLGRGSVWLKNTYGWKDTHFYLLDGNSGDRQIAGVNYESHNSFYNSMQATRDFCLANGMQEEHLFLIDVEKQFELPNNFFDLCFSIKSIGFHWPINFYLNFIEQKMKKGGYLLFELRNPDSFPSRKNRIKNFVHYQVSSIDSAAYTNVACNIQKKFPILILKKG